MSFGPSKESAQQRKQKSQPVAQTEETPPQQQHRKRRAGGDAPPPASSARGAKRSTSAGVVRRTDEAVRQHRGGGNSDNRGQQQQECHNVAHHVPASCNASPADGISPLRDGGGSPQLPSVASAWVTPRPERSPPFPSIDANDAPRDAEEAYHKHNNDDNGVGAQGSSNSCLPNAYTVLGGTGCGQIFDLIKDFLVAHRSPQWRDGGDALLSIVMHGVLPPLPQGHGQQASPSSGRPSALLRRGSAAASRAAPAAPCCDRLAAVSLYLGDKASAERFLEESRIVAMRMRRRSSAVRRTNSNVGGGGGGSAAVVGGGLLVCPHQRALHDALERRQVPSPPTSSLRAAITLVNYIEGFRCITLKSRLVRTMLAHYHGKWDALGTFLPVTYQLSPDNASSSASPGAAPPRDERNELVQAMCLSNAAEFEATGEIATYWIAKTSHGAHGSNIRIFFADQIGLDKLIRFIDGQKEPYPWVVSRYVDRPLLYQHRKFDLRHWVLVTPSFDIYLHRQLVMRTSSERYDRNNLSTDNATGRLANITNHCVQAEGTRFAQYEAGNELWRVQLDRLVREHYAAMSRRARRSSRACAQFVHGKATKGGGGGEGAAAPPPGATLDNCIMPQIRHIIVETIRAARPHVPQRPPTARDPPLGEQQRRVESFQLMGYDFIVDDLLNVWLLEVNGSPGVAQKLIHTIVEDTVELVVDPLFPVGGDDCHCSRISSEKNEFDCIMKGVLL